MGFVDAYKHLEKLCGEVLNDDRRISAYIDEMVRTPRGPFYVRSWEEDLKKLKHYRWIRNQIAHEPGCNENNMCEPDDEDWLNMFYLRIMNQTDPLSIYRKATTSSPNRVKIKTTPEYTHENPVYIQPDSNRRLLPEKVIGCVAGLIAAFAFVAIVVMLLQVM